MFHWLYTEFTKISSTVIFLTQLIVHWEDIFDRFAGWFNVKSIIERRHTMSIITEIEALIKVVPQIEQVIADAKAAEQTPQVAQLIADLEAIIAEVKTLLANPTPTPTTPAA
jgi:hypothetical protein